MPNSGSIVMVGFDFGTTTSSAVFSRAQILKDSVTGRMELSGAKAIFRSEPVFTPYHDEMIDEQALSEEISSWMAAAKLSPGEIGAGGAIVTGLAAQSKNAVVVSKLVRTLLKGRALMATANDPSLESWLAFMGSCRNLSLDHPEVSFINFDIGGGTTNVALGRNGDVSRVGCYFIGARHLQLKTGTSEITNISSYGREVLNDLGMKKVVGDLLTGEERSRIASCYVSMLRQIAKGAFSPGEKLISFHEQVAFQLPALDTTAVFTFSGGVGEILYEYIATGQLPGLSAFGDLGVDLAREIAHDGFFSPHLKSYVPENRGRATAFGIALHNTEISGQTIFLPSHKALPLFDLPIVGAIASADTESEQLKVLELAKHATAGACLRITGDLSSSSSLAKFSEGLLTLLNKLDFPSTQPLVLLAEANVGKTLGSYATAWGKAPRLLIVIDEVVPRKASFVNLGEQVHGVVPLTYFGM
jgi:ethanolamine utilization protein EutA